MCLNVFCHGVTTDFYFPPRFSFIFLLMLLSNSLSGFLDARTVDFDTRLAGLGLGLGLGLGFLSSSSLVSA